jgi:hypothetical protein
LYFLDLFLSVKYNNSFCIQHFYYIFYLPFCRVSFSMELKQTATRGMYGGSTYSEERPLRRYPPTPLASSTKHNIECASSCQRQELFVWGLGIMTEASQSEFHPQYRNSVFSTESLLFDAIARRGQSIAELDDSAFRLEGAKTIVTVDCSNPHEIDDGILVRPLPSARPVYQVDVCVADVSSLYKNTDVLQAALSQTRSEYFLLNDGEQGYEPMIERQHVLQKELSKAALKNAVIMSFVVGDRVAPQDFSVNFASVKVLENYDYRQFSELSSSGRTLQHYAEAARYIQEGIRYNPGGDSIALPGRLNKRSLARKYNLWSHGSKLNEAFMVASNHLLGTMMRDEDLPAIYRVHGNAADMHGEILPPDVAWYSQDPGFHRGLGIGPYCQGTSGLRRLPDFIMHHHLRLRDQKKTPTDYDMRIMEEAIRNLNRRAIYDSVVRTRPKRQRRLTLVRPNDEDVA